MPDTLRLNIPSMDTTHEEFLEILKCVKAADKTDFLALFNTLIEHTQEHFAFEEDMMQTYNFYAQQEHRDEHANLLDEMHYFYKKAQRMPVLGRSYINDYALEKFTRHIINIDSQFAMFLKENHLG